MYTGIIDHIGKIIAMEPMQNGLRLTIASQFNDFQLGESIALDGICVTVTAFENNEFQCELSPETLRLTTAKNFELNTDVNLERSLTLNERLGGHFVMGHVDTTLKVRDIETQADFTRMVFGGADVEAKAYFIKKGSVSINGISLTINELHKDGFEVMLIPHTLEHTTMQFRKVGDHVNIEYDSIARIVVHQFNLANYEVSHHE